MLAARVGGNTNAESVLYHLQYLSYGFRYLMWFHCCLWYNQVVYSWKKKICYFFSNVRCQPPIGNLLIFE